MAYNKEEKFEILYKVNGAIKTARCSGRDKYNRNLQYCKDHNIEVLEKNKLYPFSTIKNQHNFDLINNICANRMHDMEVGEIPFDENEYDRLFDMKQKAERFFCAELPVAWFKYDDWKEAKELSTMAILHRQDACIAAGRPELVSLC